MGLFFKGDEIRLRTLITAMKSCAVSHFPSKKWNPENGKKSSNVIITFLIRFYAKTLNVMRGSIKILRQKMRSVNGTCLWFRYYHKFPEASSNDFITSSRIALQPSGNEGLRAVRVKTFYFSNTV